MRPTWRSKLKCAKFLPFVRIEPMKVGPTWRFKLKCAKFIVVCKNQTCDLISEQDVYQWTSVVLLIILYPLLLLYKLILRK